jgi:hypothetical protein
MPEFESASAVEVFWAVTPDSSVVPRRLVGDSGAVFDQLDALPRGWLLPAFPEHPGASAGFTSSPKAVLAPSWCDSTMAFQSEFSLGGIYDDYLWRHSSTTDSHQQTCYSHNFKLGICGLNGSHDAGVYGCEIYEENWENCSCAKTLVSWQGYLYTGGWVAYTYNGDDAWFSFHRSEGGLGRIGAKYRWAESSYCPDPYF